MTEERITTTEDDRGITHTTHVVSDRRSSDGGSGKWLFMIVLVIAVALVAYFLMQPSASEIAKDTAITDAANQVGDAAGQVGEAAENAADNVAGGE